MEKNGKVSKTNRYVVTTIASDEISDDNFVDRNECFVIDAGNDADADFRFKMETLEQRLHELDCKVRQMKEERDNVVAENEELQEQLDQANSTASAGNMRLNELRNDVNKLIEEVNRVDYMCTSQEHELKALSDRMCDLGQLKETVKELNEDTKILKEDFSRVKTHLNVAAKLELQTQEKMYESRLYHLENVLEEMRQREGHFMRLAEETAVLKDQVDALRELSVISLKQDEHRSDASKCRVVVSDELSSLSSTPLRGFSEMQLHLAVLRDGEKTIDKEMGSKEHLGLHLMTSAPEMTSPEEEEAPVSVLTQPEVETEEDTTKELDTSDRKSQNENDDSGSATDASNVEDDISLENIDVGNRGMEESKVYENAKLMLMQTDEGMPSIKVSGTLKLVPQKPQQQKNDHRGGCLPSCLISIWGYLFD